jgi:hypothetical protein
MNDLTKGGFCGKCPFPLFCKYKKGHQHQSRVFFKNVSLFDDFIVFYNYSKKINHTHKIVGPIIASTNIVWLIFYYQTEKIQIFNS